MLTDEAIGKYKRNDPTPTMAISREGSLAATPGMLSEDFGKIVNFLFSFLFLLFLFPCLNTVLEGKR